MCSKAFFSLFSLPRTKNPNSPSSKLAQTAAATPQQPKVQKNNSLRFQTQPMSHVWKKISAAFVMSSFWGCLLDFIFSREVFESRAPIFPSGIWAPLPPQKESRRKEVETSFSPPFFFVHEIARWSDLNLLCRREWAVRSGGSSCFVLLLLLLLLLLVAYILRSCVLVSLRFFYKHTRELGFPGLVVGVFFFITTCISFYSCLRAAALG